MDNSISVLSLVRNPSGGVFVFLRGNFKARRLQDRLQFVREPVEVSANSPTCTRSIRPTPLSLPPRLFGRLSLVHHSTVLPILSYNLGRCSARFR